MSWRTISSPDSGSRLSSPAIEDAVESGYLEEDPREFEDPYLPGPAPDQALPTSVGGGQDARSLEEPDDQGWATVSDSHLKIQEAKPEPEPEGDGFWKSVGKGIAGRGAALAGGIADVMPDITYTDDEGEVTPIFTSESATKTWDRIEEDIGYKAHTSLDEVKNAEGVWNTIVQASAFAAETGLVSLPEMFAMFNPVSLGAYGVARAGEIARERSKADGRTETTAADYAVSIPTMVLVTALDKIGAKYLVPEGVRKKLGDTVVGSVVAKIGAKPATTFVGGAAKGVAHEVPTEVVQEVGEYLATHYGTEAGADWQGVSDAALGGALGGGGMGAVMGGVTGMVTPKDGVTADKKAAIDADKGAEPPPTTPPPAGPAPTTPPSGPAAGPASPDIILAEIQEAQATGNSDRLNAAIEDLVELVGNDEAAKLLDTVEEPVEPAVAPEPVVEPQVAAPVPTPAPEPVAAPAPIEPAETAEPTPAAEDVTWVDDAAPAVTGEAPPPVETEVEQAQRAAFAAAEAVENEDPRVSATLEGVAKSLMAPVLRLQESLAEQRLEGRGRQKGKADRIEAADSIFSFYMGQRAKLIEEGYDTGNLDRAVFNHLYRDGPVGPDERPDMGGLVRSAAGGSTPFHGRRKKAGISTEANTESFRRAMLDGVTALIEAGPTHPADLQPAVPVAEKAAPAKKARKPAKTNAEKQAAKEAKWAETGGFLNERAQKVAEDKGYTPEHVREVYERAAKKGTLNTQGKPIESIPVTQGVNQTHVNQVERLEALMEGLDPDVMVKDKDEKASLQLRKEQGDILAEAKKSEEVRQQHRREVKKKWEARRAARATAAQAAKAAKAAPTAEVTKKRPLQREELAPSDQQPTGERKPITLKGKPKKKRLTSADLKARAKAAEAKLAAAAAKKAAILADTRTEDDVAQEIQRAAERLTGIEEELGTTRFQEEGDVADEQDTGSGFDDDLESVVEFPTGWKQFRDKNIAELKRLIAEDPNPNVVSAAEAMLAEYENPDIGWNRPIEDVIAYARQQPIEEYTDLEKALMEAAEGFHWHTNIRHDGAEEAFTLTGKMNHRAGRTEWEAIAVDETGERRRVWVLITDKGLPRYQDEQLNKDWRDLVARVRRSQLTVLESQAQSPEHQAAWYKRFARALGIKPKAKSRRVLAGRRTGVEAVQSLMQTTPLADLRSVVETYRGHLDVRDPHRFILNMILNSPTPLGKMAFGILETHKIATANNRQGAGTTLGTFYSQGFDPETDPQLSKVLKNLPAVIMNPKIVDPQQFAQTLVHEVLHAATAYAANTGSEVALKLDKLRRHVIDTLHAEGMPVDDYGLRNLDEFISEAFTDPAFQQLLAETKGTGDTKTLWEQLLKLISDLFGMKITSDSALAEVIAASPELFGQHTVGQSIRSFSRYSKKRAEAGLPQKEVDPDWYKVESTGDLASDDLQQHYEDVQAGIERALMDLEAAELSGNPAAITAAAKALKSITREYQSTTRMAGEYNITPTTRDLFLTKGQREASVERVTARSLGEAGRKNLERLTEQYPEHQDELAAVAELQGTDKGELNSEVRKKVSQTSGKLRDKMMGLMTLDTLEAVFAPHFEGLGRDGSNPLRRWVDARRKEQAAAKKFVRDSEPLQNRGQQLRAKMKTADWLRLAKLIHKATMAQVDPGAAWLGTENAITRNNKQRKRVARKQHAKLRAEFKALSAKYPEVANFYRDLKTFYTKTQNNSRKAIITRMLELNDLKGNRRLVAALMDAKDSETINKIKAPMVLRGGKLVPLKSWGRLQKVFGQLADLTAGNGPYFPLMREGDFAVEYMQDVTYDGFSSQEKAREAAAEMRADDPTMKAAKFVKGDNGWQFTIKERGFNLFERESDAIEFAAEKSAEGYRTREGQPLGVSMKTKVTPAGGTVASRLMDLATEKLEGDEKAREALRAALISQLPEAAWQKHQLRRKSEAGAEQADPLTNYAKYVQGASWHLAGLEHGANARSAASDISRASKRAAEMGRSNDESVTVGRVAEEVRHLEDLVSVGVHDTVSETMVRWAGKIGFINYLLSLSYTVVNMSQTPVLTLPHLAARFGTAKAAAELGRAYKNISGQIGHNAWTSRGGLKGIIDGDRITLNHVVDDVVKTLAKTDHGAAMAIRKLADMGLIETTFALEVSEEAKSGTEGMAGKATTKIVEAGRTLPHLAEIMNRTVTVTAAYNLARGKGMTDSQAVAYAKEAVVRTHFDYSMLNRPRWFKHTYMIRSIADWSKANLDPEERRIARRQVIGMLITHGAMAGGAGALLAEPIRVALAVAGMMFGDEDDDWLKAPDIAMRRMFYDGIYGITDDHEWAARLSGGLTYGLPEMANISVHNRIGLQSMFLQFHHGQTAFDSVKGTALNSLAGPIFGLHNSFGSMAAFMGSGGDWTQAWEYALPKAGRDILKGVRQYKEGMTDFRGNQIIGPEKFGAGDLAVKVLGFSPTTEAEAYRNRIYKTRLSGRLNRSRGQLISQWVNAQPGADRHAIEREIDAWNDSLGPDIRPQYFLPRSALFRSQANRYRRERQTIEGVHYKRKELPMRQRLRFSGEK
jgi:hypothetical protein